MVKDFIIGDTENPQLFLTIKDIVARWKRKYPQEWDLFRRGMEAERAQQLNDKGIDKDGTLQYAMRIPKTILQQIDYVAKGAQHEGKDILNDNNIWNFMKREFPEFFIPKR